MKQPSDPYPKLVHAKNWEIPRPGREAVIGFFAVFGVCLALHGFILWICYLFRS